MIVSHHNKYLFISNPKTGTHTMYEYLPKDYDGERLLEFHDTRIPEECKEYFIFSTFRDPFERIVSAWNSLLFQDEYRKFYLRMIYSDAFPDFVEWLTSYPNHTKLVGKKGFPVLCLQSVWLEDCLDQINTFIPTEKMDEAFRKLPFAKGDETFEPQLKREHATWETMKNELTDRQIKRLTKWLEPDLKIYNRIMNDYRT